MPSLSFVFTRYRALLLVVFLLGLFGWNGYRSLSHFVAETHCSTVTNSTMNRDRDPPLEEIQDALLWDRHNAGYWFKLASGMWGLRKGGEGTGEEGLQRQLEIVSAMEEAVRLNPFNPQYHALLAWEYSYLWQAPDYHEKWLTAADRSMERAGRLAGERAPRLHITIGNYWIMRSKTVLPSDPLWEMAKTRARRHYTAALRWERGLRDEIEGFVWRFYPDGAMIQDLTGLPRPQG